MNIAVNARVLLKGRMEGVGRYIYETTKQMVLHHPKDQFFFFFDRPYDESFVYADNIIPIVIPPPTRHHILWYLWFEWAVPYYLKKYNIDVFYSGDTYLSMKTDVPTVLVSHDLAYLHFPDHIPKEVLNYYKKNFPKFHKKADHILAVSHYTRDDIIKQYNIDPSKISVAYNACPSGFLPLSDTRKQKVKEKYADGNDYFVYVGSLHPRKNIVNLIKGFENFKSRTDSDHKLLIIGRKAWNFEEINKVYEASGYRDDIMFLGALFDEVKEILPSSEGLLYISLFEGFGIPILEGFSSGVPVLTSDVSSMPEVAGDAALLIDPFDVEDIGKGIEKLATDDLLRSELIESGFKRLEDFTWKDSAEEIYRAISSVYDR